MIVLGIDPGPRTSGAVVLSTARLGLPVWPPRLVEAPPDGTAEETCELIRRWTPALVVCEWLVTYGAAVGATVLDTARAVGRFEQTALLAGARFDVLTRPEVCLELCQSRRAKKTETKAAIMSLYPESGGGSRPVVGTKKDPGPLYGVKGHSWDALAVVVAHLRTVAA